MAMKKKTARPGAGSRPAKPAARPVARPTVRPARPAREAVIVASVRTAVGKAPKGTLRQTRPDDMAAAAIRAALARVPELKPERVEDVILGCAMPEAEQGMNVARQAALLAGIPASAAAMTVNRFCASGLQAIALAARAIEAGEAEVIVAGGTESMSLIPMGGHKISPNPTLMETYPDVYLGMGLTAENVARKYGIGPRGRRPLRPRVAPQGGGRDRRPGRFRDEIVPLPLGGDGEGEPRVFDTDEGPRRDTDLAALAKLKPAFAADGIVTAGNASQMSDGAAATVLLSAGQAKELGLRPLARLVAYAVAGVPPEIMGIGPVEAIPKALRQAGLALGDIDLVELNEAFACQALAVIEATGLDPERVNVNGGAVALGHPLGCTGAKLLDPDPARDGPAEVPLRPRHDVRGGRDGRGRDLRTVVNPLRGQAPPGTRETSMATEAKVPVVAARGGSFLIEDRTPDEVFTPEDFSEEQVMIGQTADDFMEKELVPRLPELLKLDYELSRELLRKAGELGLLGVEVPEEYGGLGLDKVSGSLVAEKAGRDGSFATTFAVQVGIGTLPIVYFGTEAQKKKYLPKLASGEWVSSYSLSEASSASDAMNAKARAVLSAGRQELDPERREDVAQQRRLRRPLHHLRQGGRRALHRVHRREGDARGEPGRGGEEDRDQGQQHAAAHPDRRRDPEGEPARRHRQGPQDRLQHPQRRALQARRDGHRGREAGGRAPPPSTATPAPPSGSPSRASA